MAVEGDLVHAQQAVCRQYGSAFCPVAADDLIALAVGTLGQQPVLGRRVFTEGGKQVSWYIYCGDNTGEADLFKPVHAAHLHALLPQVLPYLALEEGFSFIVDDEGYEDVWRFLEEGNG